MELFMTNDKLIWEISNVVEGVVKDFGYRVCSFPGEIPEDSRPLHYSLCIRNEIDMNEHFSNKSEDKAKEAVEKAIPDLQYKGHEIEVSYGMKMWSGALEIPVPDKSK